MQIFMTSPNLPICFHQVDKKKIKYCSWKIAIVDKRRWIWNVAIFHKDDNKCYFMQFFSCINAIKRSTMVDISPEPTYSHAQEFGYKPLKHANNLHTNN